MQSRWARGVVSGSAAPWLSMSRGYKLVCWSWLALVILQGLSMEARQVGSAQPHKTHRRNLERTVARPSSWDGVESHQGAYTTEPPLTWNWKHRAACQWPASLSLGSQGFRRQTAGWFMVLMFWKSKVVSIFCAQKIKCPSLDLNNLNWTDKI